MKARTDDGRTADIRAVWFENGKVRMIDQRQLPLKLAFADFSDYRGVAEAIRNMTTRGAPCIGASAAYAMCLAKLQGADMEKAAADIKAARPTAYDLFYAVDWMAERLKEGEDPVEASDAYADAIVGKCRAIGKNGGKLIKDGRHDTIVQAGMKNTLSRLKQRFSIGVRRRPAQKIEVSFTVSVDRMTFLADQRLFLTHIRRTADGTDHSNGRR